MVIGRRGDHLLACELADEVANRARISADERLLAWTLSERGKLFAFRGDRVRSLASLQEGLALTRRLGLRWLEGTLLANLGMLHGEEGQSELLVSYSEQWQALARELGDDHAEAHALCNLAGGLTSLGRLDEAERCYEDAHQRAVVAGLIRLEGLVDGGLGGLLFARGRTEEALQAYARSTERLARAGDTYQIVRHHLFQANGLWRNDRLEDALAQCDRAMELATAHRFQHLQAQAEEKRAETLIRLGRVEEGHQAFRRCVGLLRVNLADQVRSVEQTSQRAQATLLAFKEAGWERQRLLAVEESNRALAVALAEQERLRQELERAARTDPLTAIANRRAFDERLALALASAGRRGLPVSLGLFDLDHFKRLNDSLGHAVGDEVLIALAFRVEGLIRETDLVARWGGEEFALLLPDTGEAGARALAEKVLAEVAAAPFATSAGPVRVTVSFGLATLAERPFDADALLRRADHALYASKRAGRNRATAWSPTVPPPSGPGS